MGVEVSRWVSVLSLFMLSDSELLPLGLGERWEQLNSHTKFSLEGVKDTVICVDLLKHLQRCQLDKRHCEHMLRNSDWGGFKPVPDIHQVCIHTSLLHFQKVCFWILTFCWTHVFVTHTLVGDCTSPQIINIPLQHEDTEKTHKHVVGWLNAW